MSLRVIACFLFVIGFSIYAYRNWFVSLCATVFLMAFLKHPDMPRGVLGIPGLNMWNLLMGNVLIAWRRQRQYEDLDWDMPPSVRTAVKLYFAVITISFLRMFINPTPFYIYGRAEIFIEYFLNSIRFLIPAFLLYDGCRTRNRTMMALGSIVLLYFLLAIQVIRYMGIHPDFSGSELSGRAARIVQHSVGYDRVDMSMMLSGASWVAIAFSNLLEKQWQKWALRGAALVIVFGQALTGGRTGYVTWGAIGLVLCTLRWRRFLPLIPLAAAIVVMFMPSVAQRMLSGFGGESGGIVVHENESEITSGRNLVWPAVIAKIKQAPLIGYGRQAMVRTGLSAWARDELGDEFEHPHEAYFEMLLDNGVIGLLCIVPLFYIILKRSAGLFMDRGDKFYEAAGAVALALVLALLIASFGAQTLYPREGVVGMWAAIGVALRLSVERARRNSSEDGSGSEEPLDATEEHAQSGFAHTARVAVGGA
jgi:O-antigen ligase